MERFLALASRLGHDVEKLKAGESVESVVTVRDVDELRKLLHDGLSREARSEKGEDIRRRLGPLMSTSAQGAPNGLQRRVEAYVFADEPLSSEDRQLLGNVFPMPLVTVSYPDKTLAAGEVWDLGTSGPTQVVNINTLTMESGSSIVVHNTVLSLFAQTLVRNGGGSPGANYDIGIFGRTGPSGAVGSVGGTGGAGKGGRIHGAELSGKNR